MRKSQAVSVHPVIEQAIGAINDTFERERQSQKIAAEFDLEYERLLAMPEATAPATKLETLTRNQLRQDVTAMVGPAPRNNPAKKNEEGIESSPGINYEAAIENYRAREEALLRPHITRPKIENFYPWRHSAELAAESLGNGGWATEAGAILDALHELPKQSVPIAWEEPGAIEELRDSIRTVANRVLEILIACVKSEESVGEGLGNQAAMSDPDGLSPDGLTLRWGGELYPLKQTAAKAVRLLVDSFNNHFPHLHEDYLKAEGEFESDMRRLVADNGLAEVIVRQTIDGKRVNGKWGLAAPKEKN